MKVSDLIRVIRKISVETAFLKINMNRVFLALLCLALLLPQVQANERPRIGLVLSGGGARGAAHIGVLETLEKLRVPIDCVAGTSMGALVAGVWAAGMSPERMRTALGQADWGDMFIDYPDFSEMSHRHKAVAREFLPGSESGVTANGVTYQSSVVAGQKIKLFFNQLVRANQGERNMEDLPLPVAVIATDIGNGERVVFNRGPLTHAMRASMAVPGLIAPVDHQGRKLVDGGLVDNLPVAEVKRHCAADVVIAVDVGSPLLKAEEVGSLLSISAQMIGILTQQNVERSLAQLSPRDIYIRPALSSVSPGDFAKHAEAIAEGRAAAEQLAERLAALSVAPADYARWWGNIEVAQKKSPRIDAVEIVGLKRADPAVLLRHLHVQPGDTIRPTLINADLLRAYGDGWYESVDYTVISERERTLLRVMPTEKPWGPDYVRLGLNLQADNNQGASFVLRAAYHQTWLNPLGGDLLYTAEIGTTQRLGVDYYQPLDPAQRYFVQGIASAGRERTDIYQSDRRNAQYIGSEIGLRAYAGYNVGLLGPIRLGWVARHREDRPDIGTPVLPRSDASWGGWQLRADFDQFDRLYFPTRGWAANLAWFRSAQKDYSRADLDLRAAWPLGGTVLNARLRYTASPQGSLPIYDAGTLGGFRNLSAYAARQIIGDDIRYAGIAAERIIGRLPLGLRGDMRIGLALETARVGQRFTESQRSGTIDSTALYIGGETPFGPTYLGLGYGSGGVSSVFLFVGTP